MDVNGVASSVHRFLVFGTLALVCRQAVGPLQAGATVYRCTDNAGKVELRQTYCPSGEQQRLLVETPNLGWVRSTSPASPRQEAKSKRRTTSSGTSESGKSKATSETARQHRCWQAESKLERVQRQLRKGYRPEQGEKLRQRRREQEQYLQRFCRR